MEWLGVARQLQPGLTDAEYERMWADFVKEKEAHERRKAQH